MSCLTAKRGLKLNDSYKHGVFIKNRKDSDWGLKDRGKFVKLWKTGKTKQMESGESPCRKEWPPVDDSKERENGPTIRFQ